MARLNLGSCTGCLLFHPLPLSLLPVFFGSTPSCLSIAVSTAASKECKHPKGTNLRITHLNIFRSVLTASMGDKFAYHNIKELQAVGGGFR